MNMALSCIACLISEPLQATRFAREDGHVHELVLRGASRIAVRPDFNTPPPALGQQIHQVIRHLCGKSDPYDSVKEQTNQFCLNNTSAHSKEVRFGKACFLHAQQMAEYSGPLHARTTMSRSSFGVLT